MTIAGIRCHNRCECIIHVIVVDSRSIKQRLPLSRCPAMFVQVEQDVTVFGNSRKLSTTLHLTSASGQHRALLPYGTYHLIQCGSWSTSDYNWFWLCKQAMDVTSISIGGVGCNCTQRCRFHHRQVRVAVTVKVPLSVGTGETNKWH